MIAGHNSRRVVCVESIVGRALEMLRDSSTE